MTDGAAVIERQSQQLIVVLARTIFNSMVETVHQPLQTAVAYQEDSGLWRSHRIAAFVFYITDGDIEIAAVQLGSSLVHVDQQLMTLTHEAELQVLQFLEGHYRSSRLVGDVSLDYVDRINEHVVTYRRGGRLAGHRVFLITDIAVGIQMDLLAISIRQHLDLVVLLTLLTVEGQVGQQTSLIAIRTLRRVGLDERQRQSLCKEAELIDVTSQPVAGVDGNSLSVSILLLILGSTKHWDTTTDSTEAVGSKRGAQLLIDVDVNHVDTTVHRHGVVVPLSVTPVARNLHSEAVRTVHQLLSLEGDVESVLSTILGLCTGTVADQYTTTVAVGLEPEHQRIVLFLRAVHSVCCQLQTLVDQVQ